jgi:hypothetical protein
MCNQNENKSKFGSCLQSFPVGCRALTDNDRKSIDDRRSVFKHLELIPFKLDQDTIFVLAWKSSHQLLNYHYDLLYVETDTDPNTDVLVDKERNIQLRQAPFIDVNYQNPDVSSWIPDSSDYTYSEINQKVFQAHESDWIKTYGKGAYVTVARGQLVSVSDKWCDWEKCPALLAFVNYIGYKSHEITSGIKCYDSLVFPQI